MVNINNNYMDSGGKVKGQTWKDKINQNKMQIMEKKQKQAQDIEEISCSVVPKSELDMVEDRAKGADEDPGGRRSASSCELNHDISMLEEDNLGESSSGSEKKASKTEKVKVESAPNTNSKFIVRSMVPQATAVVRVENETVIVEQPPPKKEEIASSPLFKRVSVRDVQRRKTINFHEQPEEQNEIVEASESNEPSEESSEHVSRVSDFDSNQARAFDEDEPVNVEDAECGCEKANQRKFQDSIEDGKGEIWLFRAKTTTTEHSFDVYSFRNLDALTKGVVYMSLKDGVAAIVTKSSEDEQKNNLYFVDKGNQSLLKTFGDFENLEIG